MKGSPMGLPFLFAVSVCRDYSLSIERLQSQYREISISV